MENTNTFHYESLDQNEVLRIFNELGYVDILIPLKHAKAASTSMYIAKYFKCDIKTLNKSKFHTLGMLLFGWLSVLRNFLFHNKLMEVTTFYVLAKPMDYSIDKLDDETCLLRCEKS